MQMASRMTVRSCGAAFLHCAASPPGLQAYRRVHPTAFCKAGVASLSSCCAVPRRVCSAVTASSTRKMCGVAAPTTTTTTAAAAAKSLGGQREGWKLSGLCWRESNKIEAYPCASAAEGMKKKLSSAFPSSSSSSSFPAAVVAAASSSSSHIHTLPTGAAASMMSPPSTTSSPLLLLRRCFSAAAAARASGDKHLLLTLSSPSEAVYIRTPVQSVTVPGSEGAMTLTNGHSQIISRLKAGEIIVRRDGGGADAAAERFFVSDGFLLFNSPDDDSGCCTAEVLGIELVPVHILDKEKAVAALQTLLQQGAGATDAWTKARTFLGCERA